MKKKIFLMVAAILALCLTCGMLLVACNKGGNTGGGGGGDLPDAQESWKENTSVMNQELSRRFGENKQFNPNGGRKFVADFEIELKLDDKTEANADASYKLIARANLDVDSFDTQIYLAVTEEKEGYTTPKTLFGLGYQDSATNPYIYININDGGYKKINGFSIGQLILDLKAKENNGAVSSADDTWTMILQALQGFVKDPSLIFSTLSEVGILGKENDGKFYGTRENYGDSFVYPVNVSKLIEMVSGILNDDNVINIIAKDRLANAQTEDEKNKIKAEVKAQIADVIHKVPIPFFANCDSINEIWLTISDFMQFTKVSYRIDFAKNSNEITGMGFTVNYIENDNGIPRPYGDYTLSLNTLRLDQGTPIADIFAGTGIDEVADDAAINILKFSVDGKVLGYSSDNLNVPNKYYNIDIDMDLNPFKLMSLVGKATGEGANERIANAIKELGYINITIDEVTADNEFVKNILTLHSNTEEGIIVLGVTAHKALGNVSIAAGGVYDINELVNVIGLLVDKSQATSSAIAAADFDFNKVINIVKKVAGYFKYFNVANIVNNGVTVNAKDLVNQLFTDLTGKAPEGTVANAIASVLGSDVFNIKFSEFKYGECTEKETSTINLDLREDSTQFGGDAENISDSLIKQITSIGLEGKQIAKGDSNLYDYMKNTNIGYDIYEMKGINLAGEEVTTSGFIFRTEGFDPNTVGKQKVKFYIAIANDFVFAKSAIEKWGNISLNIDPLVPLYGVLVYETEIEVVEQVSGSVAATFAGGYEAGTLTLKSGKSIAKVVDGVFMFTIEGEAFPQVVVWDGSKLVVKDGLSETVNNKFSDIKITLTSSNVFPSPIDIATGISQDAASVVVGQGMAWTGFLGNCRNYPV
ncbi:MAG: hypothetical protein ACLUE6_01175 [Acutalibacteraceae bacterium]